MPQLSDVDENVGHNTATMTTTKSGNSNCIRNYYNTNTTTTNANNNKSNGYRNSGGNSGGYSSLASRFVGKGSSTWKKPTTMMQRTYGSRDKCSWAAGNDRFPSLFPSPKSTAAAGNNRGGGTNDRRYVVNTGLFFSFLRVNEGEVGCLED